MNFVDAGIRIEYFTMRASPARRRVSPSSSDRRRLLLAVILVTEIMLLFIPTGAADRIESVTI